MNNKDLLDKKMYAWLKATMKEEGYYFRALKTEKGMKYKLLKNLKVVSEFYIDFNLEMSINGIKVEMNCKKEEK